MHKTVEMTPAMAVGAADHPWSILKLLLSSISRECGLTVAHA